jgi:glycosyltransferase involved in cell wall biosynthesis
MKEILIDLYKLRTLYSGLGQFSLNFAREIMNQVPEGYHVSFLVPHNYDSCISPEARQISANYQKRYLPFLSRNYALWHSLNQFPSHQPNKRTFQVLTVHDLNFLTEKNTRKSLKYLSTLQRNIDRADCITAISNSTRKAIEDNIDLKGKKIRVIYNGVKVDDPVDSVKPGYVNGGHFFFSLGIFNRKKNFHILLPMMKYFKDFQLVIAGDNRTSYGNYIKSQVEQLKLNGRVITPGIISESEKSWLYSHCSAFLFPSLAEGFGLPVVEAMKCGSPVFLNGIDPLREIAGDNAFYFDSFEEKDMHSFINRKLVQLNNGRSDMLNKAKNHAAIYSWKDSIKAYLRLYREILDSN